MEKKKSVSHIRFLHEVKNYMNTAHFTHPSVSKKLNVQGIPLITDWTICINVFYTILIFDTALVNYHTNTKQFF